jgi:hypothetical protein
VLPDGAGDERVVIAGEEEDGAGEGGEDFGGLLDEGAVDGVVLEGVAGEEEEFGVFVFGEGDGAGGGLEASAADGFAGGAGGGGAHADLPIGGVEETHGA